MSDDTAVRQDAPNSPIAVSPFRRFAVSGTAGQSDKRFLK
jgi:hypothetical protein